MKTKLICILSLLLLCGCHPRINENYKVNSCDLMADGAYRIEIMTNRGKRGKEFHRFYSNMPCTVGSNYVLRMEEVK